MRYFLAFQLVLAADQMSSLEDSTMTLQFLVSRSVVLYLLCVWFMFLLVTHFHAKAIENCTILESRASFQHDREFHAIRPEPSAPSYVSSVNSQPLLGSSRLNSHDVNRPTAPSYIPSIRGNPFLDVIEEEEEQVIIILRPSN